MKYSIAAAVLLASSVLATAGAAQDRMTVSQCSASLTAFGDMIDLPNSLDPAQIDDAGWCVFNDVDVSATHDTHIQIGVLRWRASDIDRFIADGLPPRAFEIEGEGFQLIPHTGDEVLDYLMALQMNETQMKFGASVRWDGVQNAVLLDTAYFEFDDTNRIEGSARIEGVDLTNISSIQTSFGTMGLRTATLKAQFDGWFQTYVAMILGNLLLERGDMPPEVQVVELQRQATAFLSDLPEEFVPEPSRLALEAFIMALPTPRGTAQLQLSAQPVIGAAFAGRIAVLSEGRSVENVLQSNLDGVTALFTWSPAGGTQ